MKQPTKEQIKEFWLHFGFEQIDYLNTNGEVCGTRYAHPEAVGGGDSSLPDLDLNNLFKYAVPKLFELGLWYKLFSDDGYHFCVIYKEFTKEDVAASIVGTETPALALFWAIWKAIK